MNEFMDKLNNKDMHMFSPKLNEDMQRTRKSKKQEAQIFLETTDVVRWSSSQEKTC